MMSRACPRMIFRAMIRTVPVRNVSPLGSLSPWGRARVWGHPGIPEHPALRPFPGGNGGRRRRQRHVQGWGWCGAIALVALVGVMGCHATAGRVIGQRFVSRVYAFEVPLPGDEWVTKADEPSVLAFTHAKLAAGISVSVTCTRESQAPLDVLARHLFFGFKGMEILRQEPRTLDGVAALQTVARARLDAGEVQVNSYVAQHQGCVYDMVYFAHPEDYSRGEPGFERMLAGFRFLPR
jgi:hypothetical protein